MKASFLLYSRRRRGSFGLVMFLILLMACLWVCFFACGGLDLFDNNLPSQSLHVRSGKDCMLPLFDVVGENRDQNTLGMTALVVSVVIHTLLQGTSIREQMHPKWLKRLMMKCINKGTERNLELSSLSENYLKQVLHEILVI